MAAVHYNLFGQGLIPLEEVLKLANPSDLGEESEDLSPQWVDIMGAGPEQVSAIAKAFRLHPVTEEDILEISREKVENFSEQVEENLTSYRFFIFNEFKYQQNARLLDVVQIKVVVMRHCVLSFHNKMADSVPKTVRRIHDELCNKIITSSWVVYGLLDEAINQDMIVGEQIVSETHLLDSLVLRLNHGDQNELLHRISCCRKKLMDIRTSLWAKREIVKSMTKHFDKLEAYLRDVLDHVIGVLEKLAVSMENLNHLDNIYLTRVSLEISQASARMSETMNRFSAAATIFLPLTVITGLWGMNVKVPGQLESDEDTLAWFYSIAAGLVIICLLMGIYFHRRDWL